MISTVVYRGNIIFTKSSEKFTVIENGYIFVKNGKVDKIKSELSKEDEVYEIIDYKDKLIIPGFIDLHLHAPQYANLGLGMDKQLLEWLDEYAFPEESKFKDLMYTEKVYKKVVKELWRCGTTRSVVFGSVHKDATKILMDLFIKSGLGAFVGKVNMDRNSPDYIIEDTQKSINDTEEIVCEYSNKSRLVKPIITPRFVPSCSSQVMQGIGAIAKKYNIPVQSHLSENISEIQWVKELHPECKEYGNVYNKFGLFGEVPTIMAHCIYSSEREMNLIKNNGVIAVHCPTSNLNVATGIMPVRKFMEKGITVGLGCDISGGHKISIPNVMVAAVQMSKMKWLESDKTYKPLTTAEVFYMGTKAGGKFFGKVGSFEEGYEFDALIIDDSSLGDLDRTIEERLQRYIYIGDDRNIVERYVAGQKISEPKF
ncbi:guanine deaminase [Clostridium brassicae]|uniref:Guanine deaminase n=1 Tax=Clostridium brassicae TaxID=2999072 RepID=A0ABT4D440_9CLOT|nr:guanine deaminase [Clostridium brassicae]MCY6957047.1 guanine deaminase [Clostridium brassicae]